MANVITGRVIAFSNVEEIASKESGKQPMKKRSLYLDCTRYDQLTGERGFENTPLLEFGGKGLEKLEMLIQQGLKKDDVVTVSFDIQGSKYTKDGKTKIFTRVRPYDIELRVSQQATPQATPQQPAAHTPPPAAAPADDPDLPF